MGRTLFFKSLRCQHSTRLQEQRLLLLYLPL
nr:MAG TPA: hypothetical protein [Caudoviricetes sp.]